MNIHKYRRKLDDGQLRQVLDMSDVDSGALVSVGELGEASYNTVYRMKLADGQGLILKVAPDPQAPGLTHEHDLIGTEAMFYRATHGKIPVPEVVYADDEYLLMTQCPGANWFGQREQITDRATLRAELGQIVAALHEVTGTAFGYPQNPLVSTWREAFTGMMADVLNDAEKYRVPLPVDEIRELVAKRSDLLDVVTTPVLVHFDLWDGNILIDQGRISGLVDGERAFWGDPVAEFVSLSLFGDIEEDRDFRTGYHSVEFDVDTRRRLALYRSYLYLIMIVEGTPRGYDGEQHEQVMELTRRLLTAQLDFLRRPAG